MHRQLVPLSLLSFALAAPAGAATFVVNDFGDAADANVGDGICDIPVGGNPRCTLRAAIQEANVSPTSTDTIEFSLGLITINVTSALPTITGRTIIDARTAPGFDSAATSTLDATPSVYIDGASIGGITVDGLRVSGDFTVDVFGLGITNFPDNGIEIIDGGPNLVDGNWIGVNRDGTNAGNGGAGVFLDTCDRCIVGQEIPSTANPEVEGIGNVISSNGEDGVYVFLGNDNGIAGNHIGENPVGGPGRGNGRHGIWLFGGTHRIGQFRGLDADTSLAAPNRITNNGGDGIRTNVGGNDIRTNYVFDNAGSGVVLNGASSQLGFGSDSRQRNYIQGNGGHGVLIGDQFASRDNRVEQNWIYQNDGRGVQITNGDLNDIVGNDIFDNGNDAVRTDSAGNEIRSNRLGLISGFAIGNAANGVVVNAGGTLVRGNVIAAMADDGIDVVSGTGSTIELNFIGTDASGSNFGNTAAGIRVRNGTADTLILDNTIGHNADGIHLEGSGTSVCDNRIGVTAADGDIGNAIEGVRITGGGNIIGFSSAGCPGNVIGHNASDGIEISGDANIVRNNTIGGVPGIPLGNGRGGVLLTSGADFNELVANVIHDNGDAGVRVGAAAGARNRIEANFIDGNSDIGIDLGDNGVTPNDPSDTDTGPNNLQNYPVLTAVTPGIGELTVSYHVDSQLAASNYPLQVDFHINQSGDREGFRVHSDTYSLAPGATRTISFDPGNDFGFLTATAIDIEGNTSEFTAPVEYGLVPLPDELFADGFEEP